MSVLLLVVVVVQSSCLLALWLVFIFSTYELSVYSLLYLPIFLLFCPSSLETHCVAWKQLLDSASMGCFSFLFSFPPLYSFLFILFVFETHFFLFIFCSSFDVANLHRNRISNQRNDEFGCVFPRVSID